MGRLRDITLVLPYYCNQGMLQEQQRIWRGYPQALKDILHVIVVDDGSPIGPALEVVEKTGIASFRLYRTEVDRRWNWLFCRNLAMAQTTTEWALMTDIDHGVPTETLYRLSKGRLDSECVYRFSRVDAPGLTPYKPHPNSWCLTRAMFDRIGGYDERFSGYYGTDGEFRDRVHAAAKAVVMLPQVLIRYPREVIPDASTTTYLRKQPEDREHVSRIRKERAILATWRPLRLTFPWVRLI